MSDFPRMVVESGVAVLTPIEDDISSREASRNALTLTGQSAQLAIEAVGRNQHLVIDGTEYEVDYLRLRKID